MHNKIFLLLAFCLFTSCLLGQKGSFDISGQVNDGVVSEKVILKVFDFVENEYVEFQEQKPEVDGSFAFSLTFSEPTLYRLYTGSQDVRLAIDAPSDVEVIFYTARIEVKGSPATNRMNDFEKTLAGWDAHYFGKLKKELKVVMEAKDQERLADLEKEAADSLVFFKRDFQQYIEDMGTSVGTYRVLEFWDSNRDKAFTEKVIYKFLEKNPDWQVSRAWPGSWNECKE